MAESAIPAVLYRGTSHHQLRLLAYPLRPFKNIELLIAAHRSAQFGGAEFPFVDDCLSALHMAAEAATLDISTAVVIVAQDITDLATEDGPCEGGTYKLSYHLDFSELKPKQLDFCIEGRDLVRKLNILNPRLSPRKLNGILRDTRRFSREMWQLAPSHYVPELQDRSQDKRYFLFAKNANGA